MENGKALHFYTDETTAPYENGEDPFPRTDRDDEFDKKIISRLHLVTSEAQESWEKLYKAAKNAQNAVRISGYVTAGEVSAAIESVSGRIYTGVCVDTCSTLGICAERNAIFNMITNGEHKIKRVLAILPDGKSGAPCGACRELMVQLMPEDHNSVEIMLDFEKGEYVTLGELTPLWWIKAER